MVEVVQGIMLPFVGTALGAASVFLLKGTAHQKLQQRLSGFAAGVMTAACIWSLLLPALEQSAYMAGWRFVPATLGFLIGLVFLPILDRWILRLKEPVCRPGQIEDGFSGKTMLMLAVTLHNLPEGMAVGAAFAGLMAKQTGMTLAGAMTLALGIAVQNFPEGAIISMPLGAGGVKKIKAFWYGTLSGIVEPVGALITLGAAVVILPVLPYLLSFSAGAMMYVVVEELLPESREEKNSLGSILWFGAGFVLMMVMDVMLR